MTIAHASEPAEVAGSKSAAFICLGLLVVVMWILEFIDSVLLIGNPLDRYGVHALDTDGLTGIFTAPLLHGSWDHIISNSGPLIVLGIIIALSGFSKLFGVTVIVWMVSGIGVWFTGGIGSNHIGASGLVFGYLTYVLVRGFLSKKLVHILVGVAVAFFYGSVLFGVLPGTAGVSWQGHLFGAIGGIMAAKILHARKTTEPAPHVSLN